MDVHRIVTDFFNVRLNRFIAGSSGSSEIEIVKTGGLFDIHRRQFTAHYGLGLWLKDFRNYLFGKYMKQDFTQDILKNELEPLFEFYTSVQVMAYTNPQLKKDLIKPLDLFFKDLDKDLGETYYTRKAKDFYNSQPDLTVKIVNFLSRFPLENKKIQIHYYLVPEHPKYSKLVLISSQKTDKEGIISQKLNKSLYKIVVPEYKKEKTINIQKDDNIIIRVMKPLLLIKQLIGSVLKEN